MYEPFQALAILVGLAFLVLVCGAALAIGVSLGLRWMPLTIKMNTYHYKIEP